MLQASRTRSLMALCVFCLFLPSYAHATDTNDNQSWLSSIFGLPAATKLKITDPEIQGLGCVIGGTVVAVAAIVLSSAAIVVTGSRSVAAATEIAVPVIAAATMAGCLTGNAAALGLAWIARNSSILAGKVINALPDVPGVGLLPSPP